MSEASAHADFAGRVLTWQKAHGRHDLPWQHPRSAYRVWLSEIMLQQTQVATVIPYFQRFVSALPDLPTLAAANIDDVQALWSGLGYYSRARNLHRAARICIEKYAGELPREFDSLVALPGIGRSTAGAILAQAHGQRFAILDGNVKRLLCRYHGVGGWPGTASVQTQLWSLAEAHLPQTQLADYTQALMDLGATVCRRSRAECGACPLRDHCIAFAQSRVSELPARKPRKVLPTRDTVMLIARDDSGRVLLKRRPPQGVWAGLWSLPEADTDDDAVQWIERNLTQPIPQPAPDGFVHAFSHYRLQIQPRQWHCTALRLRIAETDELRWASRAELTHIGLPTPVRKLLNNATAAELE